MRLPRVPKILKSLEIVFLWGTASGLVTVDQVGQSRALRHVKLPLSMAVHYIRFA
jgi:hypothetical protein